MAPPSLAEVTIVWIQYLSSVVDCVPARLCLCLHYTT